MISNNGKPSRHGVFEIAKNTHSRHCNSTFLVLYEEEGVSPTAGLQFPETTEKGPSDASPSPPPDNSNTPDRNTMVASTPRSPIAFGGATEPMEMASPEPDQPIDIPLPEHTPGPINMPLSGTTFSDPPDPPVVQASG